MRRSLLIRALCTSVVLVLAAATAPAVGASSLRVCPAAQRGCQFTSIQAAINAASNGSTISIAAGTYKENLKVGPGAATPLTLVAEDESNGDDRSADEEGSGRVIVDGQQQDSVLAVGPGQTIKLVGLTLTHGKVTGNGGGISNIGGTVSVTRGRIIDNTASGSIADNQGFGGGIFNADAFPPASGGGNLRLVSTLVRGNTASNGGGVSTISLTAAAHADLIKTMVENNTATSGGAGGVQNCGTLQMTSSLIRNNTATQGGGLANCGNPPAGPSGTARLTNTPIVGNHAVGTVSTFPGGPPAGHGGGISNGGALTLINSPVRNNTATGPGGGIFNSPSGTVTRIHSPVTGNTGTPPSAAQCFGTTC